jgi:phosphoenolpyruvate carboxykinase (GTP)
MRILKWIVDRTHGRVTAIESPLGWVPRFDDIDWRGSHYSREQFQAAMSVDAELWKQEILSHESLFSALYDKLPKEFILIRELILSALWRSPEKWVVAAE